MFLLFKGLTTLSPTYVRSSIVDMLQCKSKTMLAVATLSLGLLASSNSSAQQSPMDSKTGAIIGSGAYTSFVENMDETLAFYHNAFGMEVPPLPESGARSYNRYNPQLYAMFDIPDAKERHKSATVPGTNVRIEVMEVQNVPFQTLSLRIQDPGVVTPIFIVRDVDAMLARAKSAQAEVVTVGGQAIRLADGSRSVMIKDLDGRFIELRQPTRFADDALQDGIVDMRLSIAVNDLASTTQLYRDLLGFSVESETALVGDKQLVSLAGLTNAELLYNRVQGPGSDLWIEFVEYQGVDKRQQQMRIQDRGAARLQLRAENINEIVTVLKNAGLHVVSEGGVAVPIPPSFKGALIADPNNFFLTLFATCNDCEPSDFVKPERRQ